jgi:MFS family permease
MYSQAELAARRRNREIVDRWNQRVEEKKQLAKMGLQFSALILIACNVVVFLIFGLAVQVQMVIPAAVGFFVGVVFGAAISVRLNHVVVEHLTQWGCIYITPITIMALFASTILGGILSAILGTVGAEIWHPQVASIAVMIVTYFIGVVAGNLLISKLTYWGEAGKWRKALESSRKAFKKSKYHR